jgi:LacI family transcriptional regulator
MPMSGPAPEETRVTLVHVARLAGVSPTTVSHVLSGKRWVAEGTRRTVQDAIARLGYRPNNVARSLRTRRSKMIAIVVPDITNSFYGVLTRGLADAVDGTGHGTYVCNTDGNREREDAFLADVIDRGVDGLVMAAGDVTAQVRVGPAGLGVPAVCVGGALDDDPHVDRVTPDDGVGSYAAVRHLLDRGRRRIAMIQGPPASGTARYEGYRRAMGEAGRAVQPDLVVPGDWSRPGGHRAMQRLISVPARPDAVFCANDLTAIGAIDALREVGLAVPGDVAVVGFDDVDAATIVSPALTTVRNPAYETGRTAGELLLSRMLGSYTGDGRTVVLPCPLVVRESA